MPHLPAHSLRPLALSAGLALAAAAFPAESPAQYFADQRYRVRRTSAPQAALSDRALLASNSAQLSPATQRILREIESRGIEAFAESTRPTVPGRRAILRGGIAYAPADAPEPVKRAIWAVNALRRKPYKWGGGHGSFQDSGYDCSGTISYALHHAGILRSPLASDGFLNWGAKGKGEWITVYAQKGHVFAVIAGLRLDTTSFSGGREGPRWRVDSRSGFGFAARHAPGL